LMKELDVLGKIENKVKDGLGLGKGDSSPEKEASGFNNASSNPVFVEKVDDWDKAMKEMDASKAARKQQREERAQAANANEGGMQTNKEQMYKLENKTVEKQLDKYDNQTVEKELDEFAKAQEGGKSDKFKTMDQKMEEDLGQKAEEDKKDGLFMSKSGSGG